MDYGFDFAEFSEAFEEELYTVIYGSEEPDGDESKALFRDIKKFWHDAKQKKQKIPKDIFKQQTKSFNEETLRILAERLDEINNWWYHLSKASRVLCLAEDQENLLMWAHYAKNHTGVVIKFKCLPELDSPLITARKVDYSCKPPVIAELNDYVKHLTGQSLDPIDHSAVYYKFFLTKSEQWSYEQEWRVFIPPFNMENPTTELDDRGQEILFKLYFFVSQEIHSIYFGCKISDLDRNAIMECLNKKDMRHVKKYNCIRNDRKYKLEFEEILSQ